MREFTQRVAIVAREEVAGKPGFWVELKTVDAAHGTRIERGLFSAAQPSEMADSLNLFPAPSGAASGGDVDPSAPLRLLRYQVLTPGGKLYEYPVQAAASPRSEGLVSSYELFEYDPSVRPERAFLGPDTLRIGRRVVPAVVERTVRVGTDDWPTFTDSATVYRLKMTQLLWRNAAVPITGFAKSLFRVTTVKMAEHPDSMNADLFVRPESAPGAPPGTAPPGLGRADSAASRAAPADSAGANAAPADSAGANAAAVDTTASSAAPIEATPTGIAPADTTLDVTATRGEGRVLAWTELLLQDLGADATPEVTQTPEPAPTEATPPVGFTR